MAEFIQQSRFTQSESAFIGERLPLSNKMRSFGFGSDRTLITTKSWTQFNISQPMF